jgi:hypothetical protein
MRKKLLLLMTLVALAPGCARYYAMSDNVVGQVNTWLEQNEFGKIEQTLQYIQPDHPHYAELNARRNDIKQKKADFISQALDKSHQLKTSGKLAESLAVLDDALLKVPQQPDIVTQLEKYTAERDARIVQLRKDMLLHRARSLVQYEPIYKELETLIPEDYAARSDIQKYQAERNEIAEHLQDCSRHALSQKDYPLAEECLSLSNALVHTAEKQTLLDKTRATIKAADDKQKTEQLLAGYQHAYDAGDLSAASGKLNELLAFRPDYPQARTLREQLDMEIKTRISKGLESARSAYTQGKYSETLDICNALLQLDPKNEEVIVLQNRAAKVSKNVEKLSKEKKRK